MNEVSQTVSEIYRIIRDYSSDVAQHLPDWYSVARVFDVVRGIKYVPDSFAGYTEVLKRPAYTLRDGGDCDDKTIVSGSWFYRKQIPFRVVTTSHDASGTMQHVYLEYLSGNNWLPFDATYSRNRLNSESPYTRKIMWENPIMEIKEFMRGAVSLAGLGDAPVVTPDDLQKQLDTLSNWWDTLKNLFRGSTRHVDIQEAQKKWKNFSDEFFPKYQSLNKIVQDQYYDLAQKNYLAWLVGYGNWWESKPQREYNQALNNPELRNLNDIGVKQWWVSFFLFHPIYILMTLADSDSDLKPRLEEWQNEINKNVTSKINLQLSQLFVGSPGTGTGTPGTGTPGTGTPGTISAGIGWLVPIIIIGGLWLVAGRSKLKGRK